MFLTNREQQFAFSARVLDNQSDESKSTRLKAFNCEGVLEATRVAANEPKRRAGATTRSLSKRWGGSEHALIWWATRPPFALRRNDLPRA